MAKWSVLSISNIVLVALLSFLYYRKDGLVLFYRNHPSRMPQINSFGKLDIRFQEVVRNCEDAYLNEAEGWALLSCDPGRDNWNTVMGTWRDPTAPPETGLYLYNYAVDGSSPPERLELSNFDVEPRDFHPLGIEYHEPSRTLFVVNHAFSGSRIELFRLDPSRRSAVHTSTVRHPLLHTPNSLAAVSERELFVSNDHHFPRRTHPFLSVLETYLSFPRGNVAHVVLPSSPSPLSSPSSPTSPLRVSILAGIPFANGVALLDPSTLAVASSTAAKVTIFSVLRPRVRDSSPLRPADAALPPAPRLSVVEVLTVPFHPDNLSVDSAGTLLIAGHPHAPTIGRVAEGNAACREAKREGQGEEGECERAPSWISEWRSETGRRDLYAGNGFGSAVTAVRDVRRGVGFAVGLYERGVLAWRD